VVKLSPRLYPERVAGNVSIDLSGYLRSRPAACNAVPGIGNSGPVFQLGLRSTNRQATVDQGQTVAQIDSSGAFVALAWPTGLLATVFYLRTAEWPAGWFVRINYETSDTIVLPIHGLILLETPSDDRIAGVELKGAGQFGWYAAGAIE
jgi:hypothetical protein